MISPPQETLRLNYKTPTRKIHGIIRVWLRSNSSSQNEDDLRRRWDLTAAGICWWRRAEDPCGPHLCDCSSGEEGRTDRHRLATLPLSLSPLHTHITRTHTHTHRFPSSSHLIGGGLEEAGATIAADGELERSYLFFPLKATFPTLLSSLPSRWCSACEKSVGYQMTRCKSITRKPHLTRCIVRSLFLYLSGFCGSSDTDICSIPHCILSR